MRIERAADATERVVICRTFCVLRLKNEFGMINSRNTGAKEILWTERFMKLCKNLKKRTGSGTGVHRADRFGLCIGKSKGSAGRVSGAYDSLVQREYHQECKRCEGS